MQFIKYYIVFWVTAVKHFLFYLKERRNLSNLLNEYGFIKLKPFRFLFWHHDLFLFTAENQFKKKLFIKLSCEKGLIKKESDIYSKLKKEPIIKEHLVEKIAFIENDFFEVLILKKTTGAILSNQWIFHNQDKIKNLIKIIEVLNKRGYIHRDLKLDNFLFEDGVIKVFDFTFLIDKNNIQEIDLSKRENLNKLMDLGVNFKPTIFKWDDFYSLKVIFKNFLLENEETLTKKEKTLLNYYILYCEEKVNTNSYTILNEKQ